MLRQNYFSIRKSVLLRRRRCNHLFQDLQRPTRARRTTTECIFDVWSESSTIVKLTVQSVQFYRESVLWRVCPGKRTICLSTKIYLCSLLSTRKLFEASYLFLREFLVIEPIRDQIIVYWGDKKAQSWQDIRGKTIKSWSKLAFMHTHTGRPAVTYQIGYSDQASVVASKSLRQCDNGRLFSGTTVS